MQIAINPTLYGSAQTYAKKRGLDLSVIVEKFLERLISSQDETSEQDVPMLCSVYSEPVNLLPRMISTVVMRTTIIWRRNTNDTTFS